jgi:glycosyltransferase involved in cell wall biosynthesis
MIIGYDAKRAFLNSTGLGNYSRWLVKVMARHYTNNQYLLYTPKTRHNKYLGELQRLPHTQTVTPQGKLHLPLWRTKGIINNLTADGVSLYHGLSHELPLGINKSGIKSVVTVHDLIFLRYPQYFGWINRLIYKAKLQYACKVANSILAISEKTKEDLVELLNVNPGKIEVIYQGCDMAFRLYQSDAQRALVKKKYNLPKRYLLTVGTIEERKNLLLLVKALMQAKSSIPLIVVGKPTAYLGEVQKLIDANHLNSRVTFLHQVSFDELPAIYQLATVFVYPSRYEGFGIPVLEALNSGVPVIAASGSCLEEAGGPESLYVDPDDAKDLAKKINKVWNAPALRQQMVKAGFDYAHNFDDEKLAAKLMHLYQNTLNNA